MAYLSEILKDPEINSQCKDEISTCLVCGQKNTEGGMWATNKIETCICSKCAPVLLDWYIDTLLDTHQLDENDDDNSCIRLSKDITERYRRKKDKKISQNKAHM